MMYYFSPVIAFNNAILSKLLCLWTGEREREREREEMDREEMDREEMDREEMDREKEKKNI